MKRRPADTRGKTDFGWLNSRHSFSFGEYHDPEWIQFGPLRVINDDRVAGGGGFPPHPHRDMEIISIVLEGRLAHKDSMGNGSTIGTGEVQYMSAGQGVVHSEMNPSAEEPVHFLQIWIHPDRKGYPPAYDQIKAHPVAGQWVPVAGKAEGAISIRQDAAIHWGRTGAGQELLLNVPQGRRAWIQAMRGEGTAGGESLSAGDALILGPGESIRLEGGQDLLWFDLPAESPEA